MSEWSQLVSVLRLQALGCIDIWLCVVGGMGEEDAQMFCSVESCRTYSLVLDCADLGGY